MSNAGKELRTRGGRIRNIREKRGLSLESVARKCEVRPSYLSLLERDHGSPGRELLFKISAVLGVSSQFIESGDLGPEEEAEQSRFRLWPELVYLAANHYAVPYRIDIKDNVKNCPAILEAAEKAMQAVHFFEYWSWARSPAGRAVQDRIDGRGELERMIDCVIAPPFVPGPALWIEAAKHIRASHNKPPLLECWPDYFERDLVKLAADLDQLFTTGPLDSFGHYSTVPFSEEFIDAAFIPVFWSAAKRWSDRRLAGWFWYLNMPAELYGPIVRIARSHDSAEAFAKSAAQLLAKSEPWHRDLFLCVFIGLFDDSRRRQSEWSGIDAFDDGTYFPRIRRGGFALPARRLQRRGYGKDVLRIELIHDEGDSALQVEASEALDALAKRAAPHKWTERGELLIDTSKLPPRDDPRLHESPPETLP